MADFKSLKGRSSAMSSVLSTGEPSERFREEVRHDYDGSDDQTQTTHSRLGMGLLACGVIPILTMGGAIPGALGFGGAAGCVSVAREPGKSEGARVGICVAITAGCWLVFLLLLGGIAALTQ